MSDQQKPNETEYAAPSIAHESLAGLTIKDAHLEAVLLGKEFLLLDGAMGTLLQEKELVKPGQLPDMLCIDNPKAIIAIHEGYIAAGAESVTTNTFGANSMRLGDIGLVREIYAAAIDCARQAGAPYIAANIGPIGEMLEPMGSLSPETAYEVFAEQVDAARSCGADLILIETMTDLHEAEAAVLAAKGNCSLPIIASMSFGGGQRTLFGNSPEDVAASLGSLGAHVVMANCSFGPDELLPVIKAMSESTESLIGVRPNAGLPKVEDGKTVYDISPADFAESMKKMLDFGVSVLGGCCGTTPAYCRELKSAISGQTPKQRFRQHA